MPRSLTQYRVFIGSPGGLEDERKRFHCKLKKYTEIHSEPRAVVFRPVGWEETPVGGGRPQELINDDLCKCDYAVFVLHDRWGSPTGGGCDSGFHEEWKLAEKLYKQRKLRNIVLFFKKFDESHLRDPGKQLSAVVNFKKKIIDNRQYLFREYETVDQFVDLIEKHLTQWLLAHESPPSDLSLSLPPAAEAVVGSAAPSASGAAPSADYWLGEARRLLGHEAPNYEAARFCAQKAIDAAQSDVEWASAKEVEGVALADLGKIDDAITAFAMIAEKFATSPETKGRFWYARALLNKGITLGTLGRSTEAIAVYDELIARLGTAPEPALREQVAKALVNKGVRLGVLDRSTEEIAVYDELIARFGAAPEPALRERVAKALLNKGVTLGELDRSTEAIAVCDELIARFGTAPEPALQELVKKSELLKKALRNS